MKVRVLQVGGDIPDVADEDVLCVDWRDGASSVDDLITTVHRLHEVQETGVEWHYLGEEPWRCLTVLGPPMEDAAPEAVRDVVDRVREAGAVFLAVPKPLADADAGSFIEDMLQAADTVFGRPEEPESSQFLLAELTSEGEQEPDDLEVYANPPFALTEEQVRRYILDPPSDRK